MDELLSEVCGNVTCPILNDDEDSASAPFVRDGAAVLESKREQLQALGRQLKGQHFRIATLQNYPLSYAIEENGTLVGKGVAFDFISYMKEKYEFDYTVVSPKEDILGTNQTGIFGMLYTNEADVAAAFLPVIPKYWQFIKYSPTLDMGEWVVLMKRPAESATGSGLLAPFTLEVWLLILASLVCVGPLIYLLIALHRKICQSEPSTVANLYSCIWFVYGALLKQGTTVVPISDSTRLLFATWWIFITILTAFYTANLTAFLTLSQFTLPVSAVEDIAAKHYSWVTKKGNAIEEAAKNELDYVFKGSVPHYVEDADEIILQDYVLKKNLLFFGEKPIVEHMMFTDYLNKARMGIDEADRCTFVITKWTVLLRARAFAYSKSFPFQEVFDDTLEHLVESGIVKYKLRDGLPNTQICPLNLGSKERQLRNTDLLLTYYIVAGGFVISAIVFIVELLLKYVNRQKLQNLTQKRSGKSLDFPAPPPPYHTLFGAPFNFENGQKKNINGRDYWVVRSNRGGESIVPIRTPSALLFQYTN